VLEIDRSEHTRWINIAVKAALATSFVVALTVPPDHLDGKVMPARAPIFLATAVIVPLIGRQRRWEPYAHCGDALLAARFLLDTLGNLLGSTMRSDRPTMSSTSPTGSCSWPRSTRSDSET
jgi:hypothetical protein